MVSQFIHNLLAQVSSVRHTIQYQVGFRDYKQDIMNTIFIRITYSNPSTSLGHSGLCKHSKIQRIIIIYIVLYTYYTYFGAH